MTETMNFRIGDTVRHVDDFTSPTYLTGEVTVDPDERGMTKVRWESGVVENIHVSELRMIKARLL